MLASATMIVFIMFPSLGGLEWYQNKFDESPMKLETGARKKRRGLLYRRYPALEKDDQHRWRICHGPVSSTAATVAA
jgi:hypothetical protein